MFVSAALVLEMSGRALASPIPPTLEALIREAQTTSPEIGAASAAVEVARARRLQVVSFSPQFDASVRAEPDVPKGIGYLRTQSATITQTYGPRTQRVALERAGDAAIDVATAQVDVVARDLRRRVIAAYFALAGAEANEENAAASVNLAVAFAQIAQVRERLGDIARYDLARTKLEVERARSEQARTVGATASARIALNALVGRPPEAATSALLVNDRIAASARLRAQDPAANGYTAQMRELDARASAAEASRRPTFTVTGGVQSISAFPVGAMSFGPTLGATVSVPVGDRGMIKAAVAEARAQASVVAAQAEVRRRTVEAEFAAANAAISTTRDRLQSAREARRQSEALVNTAIIGFRSGALGANDVLATRANAISARALEIDARVEAAAAQANLLYLTLP